MDKKKAADLAKSFSARCKEVVKSNPLLQKITSPSAALIALTIAGIVAENGIDPKRGWGR